MGGCARFRAVIIAIWRILYGRHQPLYGIHRRRLHRDQSHRPGNEFFAASAFERPKMFLDGYAIGNVLPIFRVHQGTKRRIQSTSSLSDLRVGFRYWVISLSFVGGAIAVSETARMGSDRSMERAISGTAGL